MSAVCGVRGWGSVSACLWDVCGFVRAPLAPRRFRFWCAVWACVLGPGLRCAQPFVAGLSGCVLCAFFFLCWVSLSRALSSLSPIPFLLGWAAGSFYFFSWCVSVCFGGPFPGGPLFLAWCCRFWLAGPPVPLRGSCLRCLLGGGFGRLWWCWRAVWWLWAVFAPPPLPPLVFFFGGGAACSSLCLPWLAHALARIQCCLPGCCWRLRSVWPCSGPMGRVGYVLGGLGAPSCRVRSWLCRLGGCARRLLVALG